MKKALIIVSIISLLLNTVAFADLTAEDSGEIDSSIIFDGVPANPKPDTNPDTDTNPDMDTIPDTDTTPDADTDTETPTPKPNPKPNPKPTPKPSEPTTQPEETKAPEFADVKPGDWFYDNVVYAYNNKIMMGTSDTEFAPDASVTRGMAITIIYRLEKEPEAVGTPFVDVAADAWYAKAAAWGFENKVVGGVGDNKFAPDREITREQMAVMLYNYNNEISLNDVSFEITSYEDADKVSSWALSAMKWAVANKLINGKTVDTLAPQDTLTRAEMATILKRFIEYKAK